MTGSLQIKRDKYYAVLNFRDDTGKRVAKWIPLDLDVKGNKKKVEVLLREMIMENEGKEILSASKEPLFTEYIEEWLTLQRGRIENSTWESYNSYAHRHVIPYLKNWVCV